MYQVLKYKYFNCLKAIYFYVDLLLQFPKRCSLTIQLSYVLDRTDFENLAPYKMLEAFCSTSGVLVYFTYLRYAESEKGGYQIEKLDLDH
jgi:hypothetical protein